ncbi:MAG: 4Fe-4S binding protein [Candidatus Lokiarchaeota archaeon]|nr:4Fe-4S binding protein [Candidatus Harpocratesius repetitus]
MSTSLSTEKSKGLPVIKISRTVIQFLSFFLVNYAILEFIFKTDFSAIQDFLRVLPFLHSADSAWTAGAGLLEYVFHTIIDGKVPYLFLGLIGAFGLFTGRIFCGWMCPTGFIQDLLAGIANENNRFSLNTDRALKKVKGFVLVVLFVLLIPLGYYYTNNPKNYSDYSKALGLFAINPVGPFSFSEFFFVTFPDIIQSIVDNAAVDQLFTPENRVRTIIFFVYLIILGFSIYYPRFYCKYLCPYGAAIKQVSKYSFLKLKRLPTRCPGRKECGICEQVCPMQVRILDEGFDGFTGNGECILCLECMEHCPHDAIKFAKPF